MRNCEFMYSLLDLLDVAWLEDHTKVYSILLNNVSNNMVTKSTCANLT